MEIEQKSDGELLELTVTGVLDNDSSMHFRNAIDDHVRDGWHRIVVHMHAVSYISSAGIGALVASKKRLEQLKGTFGIFAPTPDVERVLSQTRLLSVLLCDPEEIRASRSAGDYTCTLDARIACADKLDMDIYTLDDKASLGCRVIGDPQPIFESTFGEQHCQTVSFSDQSFGIGLGALGEDFASARPRFGELLAVAGAVTQSTQSRRGLPDYSMSQGEFIPQAQVLYGIQCDGAFSQLIRFDPSTPGEPVDLSVIVAECLRQAGYGVAGIVILAESAGLLGAHLRRSPAVSANGIERFRFPEVRQWLSFSPERVYARNLALIVGVAQVVGQGPSSPALDALLRPIDSHGALRGHFHAAVFAYRPLKKRTLDLYAATRDLFEAGTIQDVLHLLRDDRPIAGSGESELLGGACWVSPIREIATAEKNG